MRELINIIESRDPAYGEALWVSPEGKCIPIDEEHPEFLQAVHSMIGMPAWQAFDDDANFYAIKLGWARVVIFKDGCDVFIAADSKARVQKALKKLIKTKWVVNQPATSISIDIYADDPSQPVSETMPSIKEFLQEQ